MHKFSLIFVAPGPGYRGVQAMLSFREDNDPGYVIVEGRLCCCLVH